MILITYNDCGQSFYKDVGVLNVTRKEVAESVARCEAADDIEDVDMNLLDNYLFWNKDIVADLLTYNRDDVYCLLSNSDGDASLFYLGSDKHYGTVVGSIMAHQRFETPLIETLDE